MSVDGSFIQANADHHSRVPREQLPEIAKVNHTVREYLVELERENPVEPPVPQQEKVSTTDPDSTYATKGGPARLGYSTTIWGITPVASSWACKLRRHD
jgi:hypothetical protein